MRVEEVSPYDKEQEKGVQVEKMFDNIAPHYDAMNTAMSMGQHKRWRNYALKAAIKALPKSFKENRKYPDCLDIATGTGDVAFRLHELLPEAKIIGLDLSEGMLEKARLKLSNAPVETQERVSFVKGDSTKLPFENKTFDLVTVAYGVRNFSDLRKGISEMRRVLRDEGVLCIIELSQPHGMFTKLAYRVYSGMLIPLLGRLVSGDKKAYSYLPESIVACPQWDEMAALLEEAGFHDVKWVTMSFGAISYYIAK